MVGIHEVVLCERTFVSRHHRVGQLPQRMTGTAQLFDAIPECPPALHFIAEVSDGDSQMLGNETVSGEEDLTLYLRTVRERGVGFNSHVAFAVEAQRSVVEVGGADAKQAAVDHDDL